MISSSATPSSSRRSCKFKHSISALRRSSCSRISWLCLLFSLARSLHPLPPSCFSRCDLLLLLAWSPGDFRCERFREMCPLVPLPRALASPTPLYMTVVGVVCHQSHPSHHPTNATRYLLHEHDTKTACTPLHHHALQPYLHDRRAVSSATYDTGQTRQRKCIRAGSHKRAREPTAGDITSWGQFDAKDY